MNELFVSKLTLSAEECARLRVTDAYSCHRIVCSLFGRGGVPSTGSEPSGFQWRLESRQNGLQLILLSVIRPTQLPYGTLEVRDMPPGYLEASHYRFGIRVNPTRRCGESSRVVSLHKESEIGAWFIEKAQRSGFEVDPASLVVSNPHPIFFMAKRRNRVTLSQADVFGVLRVTDRERFIKTYSQGFGRGRAFGCGLMQIIPL